MLRHLPLLLLVLIPALGHLAAQESAPPDQESPWLFLEASPFILDQVIQSGREYTSQGRSYGYDTRLLANRQLGGRIAIQAGLGVGTWKFEQNSRYAEWWRENNVPSIPVDNPWYARTFINQTYLELPLRIRVELIEVGTGALYLRGGTSWKLPVIQSVDRYSVHEGGGDPGRLPDEELARKSSHFLNAGLGYVVKEKDGYRWYLELHYGASTGTVFDQEPGEGPRRMERYLRSARAREFGIVAGFGI